jgi:signal peptidase II
MLPYNMSDNACCKLNKENNTNSVCRCHFFWWLSLSLIVAILDQITKDLVICYADISFPIVVTSFFNIVVAFNRGAAFSLLNNASGWQNWFFAGIAALISLLIITSLYGALYGAKGKRWWSSAGLALILGGALGNLCDRVVHGYVVDFLDFHVNTWHWPAFNLADSAIVLGISMFFWDSLQNKK